VVLGPDGQPCAGAKLFLAGRVEATDKGRRQLGTADDRGRFQLTLAPDEREKDNLLVASGAGVGPDWVGTRGLKMGEEITLRLVRDDVPITGRLLDLEGRPLANISVQVHWVGKKAGGDLGTWIDRFVGMRQKGTWINEGGLQIARPAAVCVPAAVSTDKDGRFTVTGLGRDRMATLVLRSAPTTVARLQIVTRQGPEKGWVPGDHGLYPAQFTFLLSPCKPIVGTVRDRKTGQPIAGVTVAHGNWLAQATT